MVKNSVVGKWKTDDDVEACERCSVKFTLTRRRHHCRYCGCIFCSACCNAFVRIPQLQVVKTQRICLNCLDMFSNTSHSPVTQAKLLANVCVEGQMIPSCEVHFGGDCANINSYNDNEDSPLVAENDSASSEDDVSVAVAGVYSSVEDGQHTSSIHFLAALQDNLRCSDGLDILNVLMYVSEDRCQITLITVAEGETMLAVAERLVESYFRLENGPFKAFSVNDRNDRNRLLECLHFSNESVEIEKDVNAMELASCCKHVILSALSPTEIKRVCVSTESERSSIRDFFRSGCRIENENDEMN